MIESVSSITNSRALYGANSLTRSQKAKQALEELEAKLEQDIQSGKIDATELQNKLTADFGSAADGIVQEDGTIAIEKLAALLESSKPSGPPPMPSPEEMVSRIQQDVESGKISATDLQEKLTADFGDAAAVIVGSDGTVDYTKLLELLQNNEPTNAAGPMGPTPGQIPSPEEMVSRIQQDVESGKISATDLQEKLTADFGDAAAGIVGSDGTIDYDKLLKLLQNNRPKPPQEASGQGGFPIGTSYGSQLSGQNGSQSISLSI
jgi:tellurite resistance protein